MEEIDLVELLKMFWRKKILIILITILFIGIGYIYTTRFITPMYTSTTTLVLASNNEKNKSNTTSTAAEVAVNTKLVSTYNELIKSQKVLREVVADTGINITEEQLKKEISIESVSSTSLINISVEDKIPENSSKIANEIANVFTKKVAEIYNINNVQIVNQAEIPQGPSNINHKKDIVIFGLVGLLVSITYIIIANMLDTTIKSSEELDDIFGLPILASIPMYGKKSQKGNDKELIVDKDPKSPISEVFRTLRANIQFMNTKKKSKVVLITSTVEGEGKSWIAANLAVTFAQAGKLALLIDADMRKGRQYDMFNIKAKPGISNYLSGIINENKEKNEDEINDIENYIQETQIKNLYVIPSGDVPPNPSELLLSHKMKEVIKKLKEQCDVIIVDGTQCDLIADSLVLARLADTTIITTAYKQTKKENLRKVIEKIINVGGKNIGFVLNKVHISEKKYEESYYYGSTKDKKKLEKNILLLEEKNKKTNTSKGTKKEQKK